MAKEVWAPWGSQEAYLESLVEQGLHPQLLGNTPAAIDIMAGHGYEPPTGVVSEEEILTWQEATSAAPAVGTALGIGDVGTALGIDEFTIAGLAGGLGAIPGWAWMVAIAGLVYFVLRK